MKSLRLPRMGGERGAFLKPAADTPSDEEPPSERSGFAGERPPDPGLNGGAPSESGADDGESSEGPGAGEPGGTDADPGLPNGWSSRRALRVSAAALVAVILVGVGALYSPLFAVRHVTVEGVPAALKAQVLTAGGLNRRRALVALNPAQVAGALEAIPWIKTASVKRRWPDSLTITIARRTAVASILMAPDGPYEAVDSTGRVLATMPTRPPHMPVLVGSVRPATVGGWIPPSGRPGALVAGSLPPLLRSKVIDVRVTPQGVVVFKLVFGPIVTVGTTSDLLTKVVSLETVLAKVPMKGVRYIDLTVPNAPSLTP